MKLINKIWMGTLSGLLAVIGLGSCKSTKMSEKQVERQRQAYQAQLEEEQRQEYLRQQREIRRQDSIQRRIADQHKCVYGGPNMMNRTMNQGEK